MTIRYYPNTRYDPIPEQAQITYEDYKKIKGFEDVGYFLIAYVVSGGAVTANATRNDTIDASDIVVALNNDIMARIGVSFQTTTPNTTYYLDFMKEGDWSWGTAHPVGSVGVDYLTVASVTTDANGLVNVITDIRGSIGGFRLKTYFGLEGFVSETDFEAFETEVNTQLVEKASRAEVNAQLTEKASKTELSAGLALKANKSQDNWIQATLANGWTGSIVYAKNDIGFVTIRINIVAGTIADNTAIANMPSGYIPFSHIAFPTVSVSDGKIRNMAVLNEGSISLVVGNSFIAGQSYQGQVSYYNAT